MVWSECRGAAIATHPFVARHKSQLSFLAGDYLQIFHSSGDWYHARHLATRVEGIVPACCVTFYEMQTIDLNVLRGKPENIMFIEARLTLKRALTVFQTKEISEPVISIGLGIRDVMLKLMQLRRTQAADVDFVLKELAKAIDALRVALELPPALRTEFSTFSTLTTWGPEKFRPEVSQRKRKRELEYVTFLTEISASGLKSKVHSRIMIFSSKQMPWLTCPVSRELSPECSSCRLFFEYLEKRWLQMSCIW
jgi:hypothetical protein